MRLGPAEAARRFAFPYGGEELSALGADVALVVDIDADSSLLPPSATEGLVRALNGLACPTVAFAPTLPCGEFAKVAQGCDLVVGRQEELDVVLAAVEANPLASLALVQLLRHGDGRSARAGLVAESLAYSTLQGGPEFAAWMEGREAASAAEPAPGPALRVERTGATVEVTLDRPQRRNAFNMEMRDALAEALQMVVADSSIAEVVLRGSGDDFCAGGDLAEFGSSADPATAHGVRSTRNVAALLDACSARVRVEVQGACVGAGIELPAFASKVSARRDAFFQLPEVSMGLVPGAGGTVSIPRRIGRQRTALMALTGMRVDAATARDWGLVD